MRNQAVLNSTRRTRRYNLALLIAVVLMGVVSIDEAQAGRITMSDPQEEAIDGGKRLCIYSNNIYTFTTVTRSLHCPYTRTFDTEDSE